MAEGESNADGERGQRENMVEGEKGPLTDTYWINEGFVLAVLGKPQEASVYFDRALELNPRLVEVWIAKGVVLKALGRHQEAIACLKKFVELAPPQYAFHVRQAEEIIRQLSKQT